MTSDLDQCPAASPAGRVCHLITNHPGRVHVDVSDGGLMVWSLPDAAPFANRPAVPADPLEDAPDALRRSPAFARCHVAPPHTLGIRCDRNLGHAGVHVADGMAW